MKVRYDRHSEEWDAVLEDQSRNQTSQAWLDENNLDYWRHARMKSVLRPIVENDTAASWLTVGDGRYASDAVSLLKFGAAEVHATDISDKLLSVAQQLGYISAYSEQNAECLSFDDEAFDYVLCKEALHHFPRPYVALHEMFRVARRGVILMEPRDHAVDRAPFAWVFDVLRRILRRPVDRHGFEPVGNYVYAASEREIEKFLLGMHYTDVAFRGMNDSYAEGVEHASYPPTSAADKRLAQRLNRDIAIQSALERVGLRKSGLLVAVLFKRAPSDTLIDALTTGGFRVKQLPRNPYLEGS